MAAAAAAAAAAVGRGPVPQGLGWGGGPQGLGWGPQGGYPPLSPTGHLRKIILNLIFFVWGKEKGKEGRRKRECISFFQN